MMTVSIGTLEVVLALLNATLHVVGVFHNLTTRLAAHGVVILTVATITHWLMAALT